MSNLSDFKSNLSRFNNLKVSLRENVFDSFYRAKNSLNDRLNSISVPEEIQLIKENKISFSDITKVYLVVFHLVALLLIAICISVSFYFYNFKYKVEYQNGKKIEFTQKQNKWLWDYANHMSNKNPKTHKIYLKKYPFPK